MSLKATTNKPKIQIANTMPAHLRDSGEAALAFTIIAGRFSKLAIVPAVCVLHAPLAPLNAVEHQTGSTIVNTGSASELTIPAAHTLWRIAAD
jgi:hypothetical protein